MLHRAPRRHTISRCACLLDSRGYRVAPVTLDNADYQFAVFYMRPAYRDRVRREYVPYVKSTVAALGARGDGAFVAAP